MSGRHTASYFSDRNALVGPWSQSQPTAVLTELMKKAQRAGSAPMMQQRGRAFVAALRANWEPGEIVGVMSDATVSKQNVRSR